MDYKYYINKNQKQMFNYYGSKSKIVHRYPAPLFDKIIEPFAGSARYSLRYFDRTIKLVDKSEKICAVWKYMQSATEKDILSLPALRPGEKLSKIKCLSLQERDFLGMIIGAAGYRPRDTVTKMCSTENIRANIKRIAGNLFKIRHWEISNASFDTINNEIATWFIDPPYQLGGENYWRYGNTHIDYKKLSEWCKYRHGQVIVCENTYADWLPFSPLTKLRGVAKNTIECIWTNSRNDSGGGIQKITNNLFDL